MRSFLKNIGFYKLHIKNIFSYFFTLTVKYHFSLAIIGFFLIIIFSSQIISGIMLSFSLVPEPMLIPIVRDEEDIEDLYTDDFFWFHERGVDVMFIFSYFHIFRKLFLLNFYFEQEFAWKSGTFLFILIQLITFLGLVLCCTHLSDITLKIASNTLHTFFFLKTKVYWWLFTDKNLNTDTVIRLAYAHYVAAFILFFLSTNHAIDMHYDWKNDANYDGLENELQWWNEVLINEIAMIFDFYLMLFFITLYLYNEPEALSYEIFMWGDVGLITDPKFSQVAPHWYFRPLMAFLLVIPNSFLGVFGLIFFFFLMYHQSVLNQTLEINEYNYKMKNFSVANSFFTKYNMRKVRVDFSYFHYIMFFFFIMTCLYTTTFLPNGKYYQLVGGNDSILFSFFFILSYLAYPSIRQPQYGITFLTDLKTLIILLNNKERNYGDDLYNENKFYSADNLYNEKKDL